MSEINPNSILIYTESTPNPATMKFVSNKMLLPNFSVDFSDENEAKESPLASELFGFPFVRGVFISNNFVTVAKAEATGWYDVIPSMRSFLQAYIAHEKKIVSDQLLAKLKADQPVFEGTDEQQIIDVLDKYIKPAVQMDGGAIQFKSVEDGVVTVQLQGACSGCPSSTLTLKSGIEAMLKRMIPGIKEVVAEAI